MSLEKTIMYHLMRRLNYKSLQEEKKKDTKKDTKKKQTSSNSKLRLTPCKINCFGSGLFMKILANLLVGFVFCKLSV